MFFFYYGLLETKTQTQLAERRMEQEDYDPASEQELSIPNILRTMAPFLKRCSPPLSDMGGHLLGLPPSNVVYQLHWPTAEEAKAGLGFVLRSMHGTVAVSSLQDVLCTVGSTIGFEAFVRTVLQSALFGSQIGDTGVRTTLTWDIQGGGHLHIFVGCNAPGVRCAAYTVKFCEFIGGK